MELKSEYLCSLVVETGEAQEIGNGPHGVRRIIPLTGGKIEGPKIKGEVLPFGADWLVRHPDGVSELDVRATIRTDDDELIYACYRGIVDRSQDYIRTTLIFETGSEKYSWLNKVICVGVGARARTGLRQAVECYRAASGHLERVNMGDLHVLGLRSMSQFISIAKGR